MATHTHSTAAPKLSVLQLGLMLADAEHRVAAADDAVLAAADGSIEETVAQQAMRRAEDQRWALHALITAERPRSVAEVAVQVDVLACYVEIIEDEEERKREGLDVQDANVCDMLRAAHRCLNAAVPVLATAAGLDLAAMRWEQRLRMAANSFGEAAGEEDAP